MRVVSRVLALLACTWSVVATAQETIKIGLVAPFAGPFAAVGQSFRHGVDAYMAINGDTVAGRKVQMIYRDSAGADPTLAKRLAEELVVKNKVAILAGFYLTPEVAATAPVVNASKTPLFITQAGIPALIKMSPYFVRMSYTINVPAELAASYAREQGKSRAYVAVADYAPGHLVEQAFSSKFSSAGGQMVGSVRIPLNTVDFSAFAERIAAANPEVLQVFLPSGAVAIGFMKALAARGLTNKIMIIGQSEADDSDLPLFDDSIIGFRSVMYIDAHAKNQENVALAAWLTKNAGPSAKPNPQNIGGFDGMHVAYKMIASHQAGQPFDGDAAMRAIAGLTFDSPRGRVTIDAQSRELTQNFYLREVVRGEDGLKRNRVVKTWSQVPSAVLR